MQPIIVSKTQQEFNGKKYYRCGRYFQTAGSRLHRDVWEYHNGPIPSGKGWHIHHVDHDRSNNSIDNLKLIDAPAHSAHHHAGHGRGMPREAIEAAREWHGSDAGGDWHRAHYKQTSAALYAKTKDYKCAHCGVGFKSNRIDTSRFCGRNCLSAARRASGVDDEVRHCATCGVGFTVNKYKPNKYCSRSCANNRSRPV